MPRPVIHHVAVELPLLLLKEKRSFIAYTPALDLSASGSTAEKAKKNFGVVVNLFFQELMQAGTLDDVLRDMGWSKREQQWQPPVEVARVAHVPFRMPVAA
jgi:hypothetical protein